MWTRSFTPQGRVWWAALGAERIAAAEPADTYDRLVEESRHAESSCLTVVERDIPRTFADRAEFIAGDLPERLRRVLRAYAVRNTYCQGMSFVVALLLQHMPELEAFWALATIAEHFLPEGYFSEDLRGVYMDQYVAFTVFLPHRLPRLAAHLAELEFPLTLIGIRWFLCLFSADLTPESTYRLWDFVFAHGAHVLFGFTLGLLALQEEALLAIHDVADVFLQLRSIGKEKLPWERLLETARSFPSEADVAVARARPAAVAVAIRAGRL